MAIMVMIPQPAATIVSHSCFLGITQYRSRHNTAEGPGVSKTQGNISKHEINKIILVLNTKLLGDCMEFRARNKVKFVFRRPLF